MHSLLEHATEATRAAIDMVTLTRFSVSRAFAFFLIGDEYADVKFE